MSEAEIKREERDEFEGANGAALAPPPPSAETGKAPETAPEASPVMSGKAAPVAPVAHPGDPGANAHPLPQSQPQSQPPPPPRQQQQPGGQYAQLPSSQQQQQQQQPMLNAPAPFGQQHQQQQPHQQQHGYSGYAPQAYGGHPHWGGHHSSTHGGHAPNPYGYPGYGHHSYHQSGAPPHGQYPHHSHGTMTGHPVPGPGPYPMQQQQQQQQPQPQQQQMKSKDSAPSETRTEVAPATKPLTSENKQDGDHSVKKITDTSSPTDGEKGDGTAEAPESSTATNEGDDLPPVPIPPTSAIAAVAEEAPKEEEHEVDPMRQDFHFYVDDKKEELLEKAKETVKKALIKSEVPDKAAEEELDPYLVMTNLNERLIRSWEVEPQDVKMDYLGKEEADRRRFQLDDEVASRHCATLTARSRSPKLAKKGFGSTSNEPIGDEKVEQSKKRPAPSSEDENKNIKSGDIGEKRSKEEDVTSADAEDEKK